MILKSAHPVIIGALIFGTGATVIMLHHYAKHGYLIDQNDVQSHEFIAGLFLMLAFGLFVGGLRT